MPIVLVHNEVVRDSAHNWNDVEGVQYHFPSKYRGKVLPGEPFVYYRGVARKSGRRGPAEYLGYGRIGTIWPDEAKKGAWYCSIVDYERFAKPVNAKVDGETREQIARNLWWDGVRALDPAVYADIMAEGLASGAGVTAAASIDLVTIKGSDQLILPPSLGRHQPSPGGERRSKRAKAIGDWAERVALRYIQDNVAGCSDCVHRAAQGETPGWDIDYRDTDGVVQRVEVKGTTGAAFAAVELTANELAAAQAHRANYWLCLVAGCETSTPLVQLVQNPAAKLDTNEWAAKPTLFAIRFSGAAAG